MTLSVVLLFTLICRTREALLGRHFTTLQFDVVTGIVQKPGRDLARQIFQPAIVYCVAYLITMAGAVMFVTEYAKLLQILDESFEMDNSTVQTV